MSIRDRMARVTVFGDSAPKSPNDVAIDLSALAAAPTVWFLHLNVCYLLVPPSCRAGHRWFLLGATVVALVLMIPPSRRLEAARRDGDPQALRQFIGRSGLWIAALFALVTLLVGASALVVGPC